MPKLTPSDIELKCRMARSVIEGAMKLQDMDNDTLAVRIHVHPRTMYLRRNAPDKLRLGQLWKMADAMKLSNNDILKLMGRNPDA